MIGEHLLPYSCSHETMDNERWLILSSRCGHVMRKFKSSIEQVFRFFAVGKLKQASIRADDMKEQTRKRARQMTLDAKDGTKRAEAKQSFHAFWKIRSLKMLDDTMSFNELYLMLDTLQLIDSKITPKKAAYMYGLVTRDRKISPQIGKENESTELVLDEFVELLARLAILHTGGTKGRGEMDARIDEWLLGEFLDRASRCMPKTVTREWQQMQDGHGSESSDSEEETEMIKSRKERHASGRVLSFHDRRGDGATDKVEIDTTGDGKADMIGFDTTGDGKIDAYDTVSPFAISTTTWMNQGWLLRGRNCRCRLEMGELMLMIRTNTSNHDNLTSSEISERVLALQDG